MKKLFKTAMLAVAVMAAGFGGVKAYKAYNISQSEIGLENIEAFSQSGGDGGYVLPEVVIECGRYEGKCWNRDWFPSPDDGKYYCHRTPYTSFYCTGAADSCYD